MNGDSLCVKEFSHQILVDFTGERCVKLVASDWFHVFYLFLNFFYRCLLFLTIFICKFMVHWMDQDEIVYEFIHELFDVLVIQIPIVHLKKILALELCDLW